MQYFGLQSFGNRTEFKMQEKVILKASFNPKVKTYWMLLSVIFSSIFIISIPLVPFVLLITFLVSSAVLKAMSAELLERKLVVKRGVWFKIEKSIPLEKITDVGMMQGPLMRVFGLYRLDFETAGQSGPGALVSMIGINQAEAFRERILQQKDLLQVKPVINESSAEAVITDGVSNHQFAELLKSVQRIEALLEKQSQ
jgi:putative membrane protein